ncbi:MAG: hypothetical protein ABL921_32825 [Pirellula sp.]
MPRLSIIVPHLQDDAGLELTTLSVLENREPEIEILIAHDGSYPDPYGLGQDEAVLIESRKGESLSSQINLAVSAACSPYIQVLMPGAIVDEGWHVESMELLSDRSIDAACTPVRTNGCNEAVLGLSGESLPHRRITSNPSLVAGPMLFGSILRKRVFQSLGGWLPGCNREVAEVEFSLLFETFGLELGIAETATIRAEKRIAKGQEAGYEIGHACGQLACAYASIEDSGVSISSLSQRLGHLASGLMSPKTVAERLGWVMGIRNRAYVEIIRSRIARADAALLRPASTIPHPSLASPAQHRRAA